MNSPRRHRGTEKDLRKDAAKLDASSRFRGRVTEEAESTEGAMVGQCGAGLRQSFLFFSLYLCTSVVSLQCVQMGNL
jgi:hypothetical protein